ncbi:MAG: hypothetical protein JNM48_13585 [Rhodospirillales bacterium]|nr:hypothetical protein [Rhodospirillales bacterium]
MTFPELRRLGVIVLPVLLGGGCAGDDPALLQTCAAADGRGNLYEATNIQMLDALESAMDKCETNAADPDTCVASGCRDAQ